MRSHSTMIFESIHSGRDIFRRAHDLLHIHYRHPNVESIVSCHLTTKNRTLAHLLDFNKNTVQRVCQLKGWQVKKRPVGFRPRVEAKRSRAEQPNTRWATDL